MFFVYRDAKYRRLKDYKEALAWHEAGWTIYVSGWVKVTVEDGEGNETELKFHDNCTFQEIIQRTKQYEKVTVSTERKKSYNRPTSNLNQRFKVRDEDKYKDAHKVNEVLSKFDAGLDMNLVKIDSLPDKKRKKLEKIGKIPKGKKGINSGKRRSINATVHFDRDVCREKMASMWEAFELLKMEWDELDQDTSITTLYHGTKIANIDDILVNGFRLPWGAGMLGRGIYAGTFEKARNYGKVILVVEVMLGNCKELEGKQEDIEASKNAGYDSLHLGRGSYRWAWGGRIRNDEWVIRDPAQLRVVGIILKS